MLKGLVYDNTALCMYDQINTEQYEYTGRDGVKGEKQRQTEST